MSHSTVSTIKNLVISARFNCCRKTSIKLTQSKSQKAKEKISQQVLRKRTTQRRHSVIENTTSEQASVVLAALFSEQACTDPKRLCDWLVSENNRIFFHEMMWYMCLWLFHIGFEVDFFVTLVSLLLGPLSSYITLFRAKCPILLANKSDIVRKISF